MQKSAWGCNLSRGEGTAVPVHPMRAYRGSGGTATHILNIDTRCRWIRRGNRRKTTKQADNGFWWSQKRNRIAKLARIFAHIQKTRIRLDLWRRIKTIVTDLKETNRWYFAFTLLLCTHKYIYIHTHTGCPRRNVPDFGRVFLMLKYTDITQNTYVQSWTVTEIMAREVWYFYSCYTLIDYQIHIKIGRNMWFL